MITTIPPSTISSGYANPEEIPGSRCSPEDGSWPRPFRLLSESSVVAELTCLAKPLTYPVGKHFKVHGVNFQPCNGYRTQDRYGVHELEVRGEKWTFTAVFDGHLGDTTVEHTAYHLPIIVKEFLTASHPSELLDPENVSKILAKSMTSFDKAIAGDILEIFPGGLESLSNMPDFEIQAIISRELDYELYKKAQLCMYGTTALVALIDPKHQNLFVANLGDCQGVYVGVDVRSNRWTIDPLTTNHNCDNVAEVERVRNEHPEEPDCVIDRRVLGALAPTRCIGDVPFKQPPEFTRKILYNIFPGYRDTSAWEEFLDRNLTAPYISSHPDVVHRKLSNPMKNGFLILCSDGMADLYSSRNFSDEAMIEDWVRVVIEGSKIPEANLAVRLLRHAIGGDDVKSVSRVITLDMDIPWIDDTTILVQTL